jgi:hypothetical protein
MIMSRKYIYDYGSNYNNIAFFSAYASFNIVPMRTSVNRFFGKALKFLENYRSIPYKGLFQYEKGL